MMSQAAFSLGAIPAGKRSAAFSAARIMLMEGGGVAESIGW